MWVGDLSGLPDEENRGNFFSAGYHHINRVEVVVQVSVGQESKRRMIASVVRVALEGRRMRLTSVGVACGGMVRSVEVYGCRSRRVQ